MNNEIKHLPNRDFEALYPEVPQVNHRTVRIVDVIRVIVNELRDNKGRKNSESLH